MTVQIQKRRKKKHKSKSPRPSLNTNIDISLLPSLNISLVTYLARRVSWLLMVLSPKLDLSDTQERRICHFYLHPRILGDWLTISASNEGRRECFQTGPTQLVAFPFIRLSSDTSEIYWHKKVIIYIYKEPEVLQTNTCLSIKTYVIFLNRHYNALSADIQNCWAV